MTSVSTLERSSHSSSHLGAKLGASALIRLVFGDYRSLAMPNQQLKLFIAYFRAKDNAVAELDCKYGNATEGNGDSKVDYSLSYRRRSRRS